MTLTTHAIVGGALSAIFPNVFVSFLLGFSSHFIIDAIPHGHYPRLAWLQSEDPVKLSQRALYVVCLDGLVGMLFSFFFFSSFLSPFIVFAGIIGGMLPDFLLGIQMFFPSRWLSAYERFHRYFHFFIIPEERWSFPISIVISTELIVSVFAIMGRLLFL